MERVVKYPEAISAAASCRPSITRASRFEVVSSRPPVIEQKEPDYGVGRKLVGRRLAKRLIGSARLEQVREPRVGHRLRLGSHQGRQHDGEKACRRVGALQVRSELEELVRLAARQ